MILENPPSPKQKNDVPKSSIVLIAVSTVIIVGLAGTFVYFAGKVVPESVEEFAPITLKEATDKDEVETPVVVPTDVISFVVPKVLPKVQKSGKCFSGSVAAPRQDAFRCMVENSIYDPCFSIVGKPGFVYCQNGVQESTGFLIKLTEALPKTTLSKDIKDTWSWYVVLKDGTTCSPFTGTRPFFGTTPNIKVGYYGCSSADKNQQVVLIGDLVKGKVWTAQKALPQKSGTGWVLKSVETVDVQTVWQ